MEKQAVVEIGKTPALDGGVSKSLYKGEPVEQSKLGVKHLSGLSKKANQHVADIIAQEQK
jgi:hypothetical protein